MTWFDYAAVSSLAEAVDLLRAHPGKARILAGGTDLLVQVREGRRALDLIVDAKRVPELAALDHVPGRGLTIGAAVPCNRIYENAELARLYPGLIDAASLIGGIQIQNRASFGGNLCNSSPAADSIPALIAHRAVCRIAGPEGVREVPVERFCTGPGRNILAPDELLVSLFVPAPPRNFGANYLRFIPRNEMDIAVVGCGASVELTDDRARFVRARIALGAVAPTPILVDAAADELADRPVDGPAIERAAAAAQAACRPIDDMRGTAEYRRHLAGVLTQRALREAVRRAKEAV